GLSVVSCARTEHEHQTQDHDSDGGNGGGEDVVGAKCRRRLRQRAPLDQARSSQATMASARAGFCITSKPASAAAAVARPWNEPDSTSTRACGAVRASDWTSVTPSGPAPKW